MKIVFLASGQKQLAVSGKSHELNRAPMAGEPEFLLAGRQVEEHQPVPFGQDQGFAVRREGQDEKGRTRKWSAQRQLAFGHGMGEGPNRRSVLACSGRGLPMRREKEAIEVLTRKLLAVSC